MFSSKPVENWCCLEPDSRLADRLRSAVSAGELPSTCEVVHGSINGLDEGRRFASILYIDVLEHIEDDRSELQVASAQLQAGGYLAVLAPAHTCLFSPFDKAIGHWRRYDRPALRSLTPSGCSIVLLNYLDSVGLLFSIGNALLFRQSTPAARQIAFWDRAIVPLSSVLDPLFRFRLGKTVVAVWRKDIAL